MRWLLACLALCMSACVESSPFDNLSEETAPADRANPPPPSGNAQDQDFDAVTAVYRCQTDDGEVIVVTRTRQNGLHLFMPPGVPAGHLDCEHDRRASIWEHAKLNGVDFRAVGNEPGWVLEVRDGDRLDLNYDYGQSQVSVPIAERVPDAASRTTTYRGTRGERSLVVRLIGEGCSDTMSDETFPTRVEVELDGRKLSGCGRPLH